MAKDSVYSWRMAAERKAALEDVARRRRRPLAKLLDEAVSEWLARQGAEMDDEAALRRAAQRAFGSIEGNDPERASQVRERVRQKLRLGHGK
jgi:hypothetical protein